MSNLDKNQVSFNDTQQGYRPFVHLHLHTEYSNLDGLIKIKELAHRAKEFNMPAVANTDHGVMYGSAEFYFAMRGEGIKPILGVEAYIVNDIENAKKGKGQMKNTHGDPEKLYYHLTLLAKNKTGYLNLLKLVTFAGTTGFYYKPLIDKKLLAKHSEGLIALSGCYGAEIPRAIINNLNNKDLAYQKASQLVEEYLKIFDKDNFFIEIQRLTSGEPDLEKQVEPILLDLAEKYKLKYVATSDVHYLDKEDADVQKILWAINTGKKVDDPDLFASDSGELWFKDGNTMYELFKDIPQALDTTLKIADMVEEYTIHYDRIQPPYKDLPKGKTAKEFLREKAYEGAIERYGKLTKEIKDRIDYELSIIDKKGYNEYFLVVADYVKWSKDHGIFANIRGSGGGSVVAYVLHISELDPLRWGLYFERFLNPERPSPPDFDIDFQDDRRDEVIEYIRQKYGRDSVAAICAIGRMDTRAAIRDVSRALGIPLKIVDKFSKLIPVKRGKPMPIKEALESVIELKELVKQYPELNRMVQAVSRIKKLARHISVHACGYLVTPDPIVNYVPLRVSPQDKRQVITQIEGKYIESLGLMKFDFLGVRTLTIIQNARKLVKALYGIDIDPYKLPDYDDKAFEVFKKAKTFGVFQLESQGMRNYLKQLQPESLDDINFLLAAYRPGPMKYIPEYIARKFGKKPVKYVHKDLEHILKETYGFAIYQEQVLAIAVDFAGYTVGEADMLRRAIGKKKLEILEKEKDKFYKGAQEKGYSKKVIDQVWNYILPFADYGFNKSHSASYAIVSYYTAYFKGNYPVEFMTALLITDMHRPDKLKADLKELKKMYIEILPPDINLSLESFTIVYVNKDLEKKWLDSNIKELLLKDKKNGGKGVLGQIRFGLGGIKGVSSKAVDFVINERKQNGEFKSLADFFERLDYSQVDKKSLILWAKAGAFDKWGNRNQIISLIEQVYDKYKSNKQSSVNQLSLLGASNKLSINIVLPQVQAPSIFESLKWERELYGTFVTSHPIEHIKKFLKANQVISIKKAIIKNIENVRFAGYIRRIKKYKTKNDTFMAFLELEDHTASIDAVLFPRMYEEFAKQIINIDIDNTPFIFTGKLQKRTSPNISKKTVVEDNKELEEVNKENLDFVDTSEYSFVINHFELIDYEFATNVSNAQLEKIKQNAQKWFTEYLQQNNSKRANKRSVNNNWKNNNSSVNSGQVVNSDENVKKVTIVIGQDVTKPQLMQLKSLINTNTGTTLLYIKLPNGKLAKYKHGINWSSFKNIKPDFIDVIVE